MFAPTGPALRGPLLIVWRTALTVVGLLFMAVGVIGLVLPTHLLGVVFVAGLMLVLRNSMRWRRRFIRLQRRHPRWVYPFRRLMRGEVGPVMWRELLRSERWVVPQRWRRLRRWRRALRLRFQP